MTSEDWLKNVFYVLSEDAGDAREESDRTTCSYIFREEPNGLSVRQATPDDAAFIASIGTRAFRDAYASVLHPVDLMGYMEELFAEVRLRDNLGARDSYCMLAVWGGAPCGFAHLRSPDLNMARKKDRSVELRSLFVAPDWVGKGVGSALLSACLGIAADRGYHSIWVRLLRDNARALALFKKAGFLRVGNEVTLVGKRSKANLLVLSRPLTSIAEQHEVPASA